MWSVHAFSARQTAILNHIPSSLPFCTGIQFSCDAIDHTMLENSPVNSLLDQAASHPTSLLSQSASEPASEPASKSVQQKQRQQPMLHLI